MQQLLEQGAQLLDVLPAETYLEEHIPGARNIPMAQITSAADELDVTKPVIVYCYDRQCDLSSRAAARLELLGFTKVYDYVDSKVAWFGDGLPSAGLVDDSRRAISRLTDATTLRPNATLAGIDVAEDDDVVVVTNDDNIVLGVIRKEADGVSDAVTAEAVMQPAPSTVRPSIPLDELARSMDKNGERYVLVTKHGGELMGVVQRSKLDAA